ncbi:MAG TPA: anhydro-N-acetylmuramic acid kinase [Ignavibacteria bacterium]|nr:anhydro-N-acetylmuramic acid kinase [Ignavibacteria bacterium]
MNNKFIKLLNKKSRLIIGLLSGTSVDGIDAVIVRITGSGPGIKIKIIDFITHPIPLSVKKSVFKNSSNKTAKIEEITRLNVIVGALFSDAVLKLLKKNKVNASDVDIIGSHGQTIHHLPGLDKFLGYKVKSTFQIGDPAIIANLTGITTIGDFRIADCAVGGDGAPLVPYLDYVLFRHKKRNRALLNIGGISNITIIPKNSAKDKVIAFDTGPGNMLIDGVATLLFNKGYDKNGMIARNGRLDEELFSYLKSDKYFKLHPPKSTGREHYGSEFIGKIIKKAKGNVKADLVRTVTEFTAYSVWYNNEMFIKPKHKIDELIVSGGGAENPEIMNSLKKYFKETKVRKMNDFGITVNNKEAVLFAVLANECIAGNAANMKSVTGSTRDVILGKISIASTSALLSVNSAKQSR